MTNDTPDWLRLHKALAIEAEQGFIDLMGRQYRFSEFLSLTFGKFPDSLPSDERRRWQKMATEYVVLPLQTTTFPLGSLILFPSTCNQGALALAGMIKKKSILKIITLLNVI